MNRVVYWGDSNLSVELGCGDEKHWRKDFIHCDINDNGQDCVFDITKGLPFKDNSCAIIYASHTFEHISRQDLIGLFNECWRCIRPGGTLWVIVPAYNSASAYIIPHYTQFDENTFKHLTLAMNPDYENMDTLHSSGMKIWDITEIVTNERPDIHAKLTPRKV